MDEELPEILRASAYDVYAVIGHHGHCEVLHEAADEIDAMRDLIKHCWVHSNYHNCGYSQMTPEQKALFDAVVGICNKTT